MNIQLETTHLYREIHEQPEVLARLLDAEHSSVQALADAIQDRGIDHVVIAARGTSDNAARYAQYLLGAANRLVVGLATPSLFTIYRQPPRFGNCLVLGVSQSGKSPDIVSVVAEAKRQGALTAALTNIPASDLGRAAEYVLDLHAGEEKSVAATKTYTAQLAAIALLSACLSGGAARLGMLHQAPQHVAQALAVEERVARVAERYCYMESCVTIGRGYNYATAFELALKLKELAYLSAEPASSADFRHGPIAMVESGYAVLLVAPRGRVFADVRRLAGQLRQRRAELLVISDHRPLLDQAQLALPLEPGQAEWLTPVEAVVPGQLLALQLARCRGCPLDRPRGLSKVTRTR